jgi:ArsR family transcriptional regulator
MRHVRCCPADCAVRSDWKEELQAEMDSFNTPAVREASTILKVLSHPSRLKIALMLLNRDHCVCEIIYELKEKQNMTSYNLGLLKRYRLIDSYYRSKHKFYKLDEGAVGTVRMIKQNLIDQGYNGKM